MSMHIALICSGRKRSPTILAASSTRLSASGSVSRRAIRSAWIVSGTRTSTAPVAACQRSPTRTMRLSSISIRRNSSQKSRIVRVGDRWQAATGAVEVRVPETIQALLISRLDTLLAAERRVLEAASIVGERFLPEQIRAICIDIDVDSALDELLAQGLVVEDTTGGDVVGLRLKHLLLRDVVYGGLAKRSRADLHDRFAIYLESATSDRGAEYAEIIAYHAALAFSLTREMRLSGNVLSRRARGARRWALFPGERAFARGDRRLLADFISNARSALEADPGDRFDTDRVRLRLR